MGLYLVGGMLHSGKKSSIFVTGSYSFMAVHMQDLLTTDEAATYLRLSERKLYELVANGAVPCTKVTGKWLFPKAALDRWLAAGLLTPALSHAPAPPIVGGSHDPLLEWALRESASGLANLPEGSEAECGRPAGARSPRPRFTCTDSTAMTRSPTATPSRVLRAFTTRS